VAGFEVPADKGLAGSPSASSRSARSSPVRLISSQTYALVVAFNIPTKWKITLSLGS
jgi:hypothetical protein